VAIDGVYAVAYCGTIGLGIAVFKVANGEVVGHDYIGSKIIGTVTEDGNGLIDFDATLQVKPGNNLVVGTSSPAAPYSRSIKHKFPPDFGDGVPQVVALSPGEMTVMVKRSIDAFADAATNGFVIHVKPPTL
jgi:hypothetical protein